MKVIRSFRYAYDGIVYCCKTQFNFRIHLAVLAFVIIAGMVLGINKTEWLFIIVWSVLVLVFEMTNTALEFLCDTISKDFHPGIKVIKDVAAGAVLICAAGSVVTGIIIFLPKILGLF